MPPAGPSRAEPHYVTLDNSRTAKQEVGDQVCRRLRDFDVAPCSVGICASLAVRGVCLGDFALQTRQADVQPCSEEVNVARMPPIVSAFDVEPAAGSVF